MREVKTYSMTGILVSFLDFFFLLPEGDLIHITIARTDNNNSGKTLILA